MRNRQAKAAPVKGSFIHRISMVLRNSTTAAFSSAAPTPPVTIGSVISPVSLTWIAQKPRSRDRSGWASMANSRRIPARANNTRYKWSLRICRLIVSFTIAVLLFSRLPSF